jgi:hypothetical protein
VPHPLGGRWHSDVPDVPLGGAATEAIRACAWGERTITAGTTSVSEHRRQSCLGW